MSDKKIMILIPAFNESASIKRVIDGCLEWQLPVIVVDDGSSDDTAAVAREAGAEVIVHPENRGKGAAFETGFAHASELGYSAVLTLDSDGQHDPSEIGLFLEQYERGGADIIVGSRMQHVEGMPWIRRLTNWFTSWVVSRVTGCKVTDSQSGYRLTSLEAWKKVQPEGSRFDWESEVLFATGRCGLKVDEVRIKTIYRDEKSKINPLFDAWLFFRMAWRALSSGWRNRR